MYFRVVIKKDHGIEFASAEYYGCALPAML
jgi:hypothetical protein